MKKIFEKLNVRLATTNEQVRLMSEDFQHDLYEVIGEDETLTPKHRIHVTFGHADAVLVDMHFDNDELMLGFAEPSDEETNNDPSYYVGMKHLQPYELLDVLTSLSYMKNDF